MFLGMAGNEVLNLIVKNVVREARPPRGQWLRPSAHPQLRTTRERPRVWQVWIPVESLPGRGVLGCVDRAAFIPVFRARFGHSVISPRSQQAIQLASAKPRGCWGYRRSGSGWRSPYLPRVPQHMASGRRARHWCSCGLCVVLHTSPADRAALSLDQRARPGSVASRAGACGFLFCRLT